MPILQIYRAGSLFAEVLTGGSETVFNGELMNMNKITSQFTTIDAIKFLKRDYIYHNGHIYAMKNVATHKKTGTFEHTYTCTFLGREYTLYNRAFRHLNNASFPFFGTAREHLTLVFAMANVKDPGWVLGEIDATEPLNIDYSKDSCRTAVTKIAEAFGLEFEFKEQVLNMKKLVGGFIHDLTFTYGMDNGLYSMTKTEVDDSTFGTIFYGFGSTDNLPANYRGGLTQSELSFDPGFVERNIAKYGEIDRFVEFPDIKPERTGTITSLGALNEVIDSTLDFNLNDTIVDGSAKIVFVDGDLRNQEFEIASYDPATKKIKFNINKDDSGYELPNATVKVAIGNKYKLIGIVMPQSYIDNAETRLKAALNEHADANQNPPFQFELEIDPIFMQQRNYSYVLNPGDKVRAVEPDMDVDVNLRITAISYPVFEPYNITATIADKVSYSLGAQVLKDVTAGKDQITQIKKTSVELQRINAIRRRELQGAIFDPDGYFDAGNIKPGSIETQMLVAGARSQDFTLDIVFKPNFNANPNVIAWTGGSLTHLSIEDVNRTWSIVAGSKNDLVATTLYYIYAKCPKVGTSGSIAIDPAQRRVDADPDYYYFLIGVLHTVILGVRPISATYGFSELNGRFLTTGRVQSADGLTWFDLDLGEIAGVIKFRSSGGGLVNVSVVDDRATNALTNAANADSKAIAAQTAAANAQSTATNAATAASNAQTSANTANSVLSDIANDNLLMPSEKQDVLKEWQIIQGERPVVVAQAGTYSISTTSYDTAYNNLNSYITPLLANMNSNSTIDGSVFRSTFKTYYDSKVALLKLISDKSKQLADAAQATANTVGGDLSTAVGQLTADATTKANNAAAAAKAYADAQDNLRKIETQAYADGIVDAEEARAIADAQAKLAEAKADATSKAEAARLAAEAASAADAQSKANAAQAAAAVDAQNKANAAQTAAQNFAAAQDSTLNTNLKVYADGKVSAEEQARLYQAQQNLDAAYADASTKAQAAKVAALTEAAIDAQNRINAIKVGAGNLLRNTYDFKNLNHWASLGTGLNIGGNLDDGTPVINTGTGGAYYTIDFPIKGNTEYVVSTMAYSDQAWSGNSNQPLHIYVGSTPSSNDLGFASQEYDQSYPAPNRWKRIYNKIRTGGSTGQQVFMRFHIYPAGSPGTIWYWSQMSVIEGNQLQGWQPSPLDSTENISQSQQDAIAAAGSYAQGLANIAQANAISAASTDAQNKANAAYNNALSAANTYAQTVANGAASQAEINAAADALNKANAAYNNAVAAANSQYQSLTASLKSLAYQELSDLAVGGNTLITGGKINTVLLDAAAIQANIVTAGYINTLSLDASAIKTGLLSADRIDVNNLVAVKLAANQGTIGPLNITSGSLWLGNENTWIANTNVVSITASYTLFRENGSISGQTREMAFNLNSAVSPNYKRTLYVRNTIENKWIGSGGQNLGIVVDVQNGDKNIGIEIVNGSLNVNGGVVNFLNIPHRFDLDPTGNYFPLGVFTTGPYAGRVIRYS